MGFPWGLRSHLRLDRQAPNSKVSWLLSAFRSLKGSASLLPVSGGLSTPCCRDFPNGSSEGGQLLHSQPERVLVWETLQSQIKLARPHEHALSVTSAVFFWLQTSPRSYLLLLSTLARVIFPKHGFEHGILLHIYLSAFPLL